jgi:hypothetical protein
MNHVTDLRVNKVNRPGRKFPKKPLLALGVGLIALGLLVGIGFGVKAAVDYFTHRDDSKQVYSEVKQIFPYLLPSEMPTVATVKDITKLQGQEFFRNAKNGDRLLVFSVAKIAIIYRQKDHSIVNFGPISSPTASSSPAPLVTPGQ